MYMELNGTKNEHKTSTEFCCEKCGYITVREKDYNKILKSEIKNLILGKDIGSVFFKSNKRTNKKII